MIYHLGPNFQTALDEFVIEFLNVFSEGHICDMSYFEDLVTSYTFSFNIAADDVYLFSETVKNILELEGICLQV